MADFTQKSVVRSAVRTLASPIADLTTFNALIQDILDNNPWGCTTYTSAGVNKPAVEKTSQYFTGKVVYEDAEAKTIGNVTIKANSTSGFNTAISNTLANTALTTAMAGSPSHDSSEDSFSTTLKCHGSNGELYSVTFKRDSINLSSYEADSIRTSLDSWADSIGILA